MFSARTPSNQHPNRLTRAAIARGADLIDLTISNPTAVHLDPDSGGSLETPGGRLPAASRYDPHPRGLRRAREAVAAYYAGHQVEADPDRIVLTASSSEAYAWLFKLVCDPGDVVLVPEPSYPLLGALAGLECVELAPYRLPPEDGWAVHASLVADTVLRLERAGKRPRAVVLVNPNNPTGTSIDEGELAILEDLALRHDLALISDEVFLDYRFLDRPHDVRVAAARDRALVFSLGGLSKAAALPQLKLGWILANGPRDLLAAAMARLDWVADTFLSVGTPVQLALPTLLEEGTARREAVRKRVLANDAALRAAFPAAGPVEVLPIRGGWSAVLRVPAVEPEEDLAVRLVERHGVLVQPGYFFDFPFEAFLVLGLLPEPDLFAAGIGRLSRAIGERGA